MKNWWPLNILPFSHPLFTPGEAACETRESKDVAKLYLTLTPCSPQEKLLAKREKVKMLEDFNSQKTMQRKKDEYVQTFTIHGLSKIFTGTKIESIFWTCVVLFGICISNIVIYGKSKTKIATNIRL